MSANDKASATYGPGRTTPPLEARVKDAISWKKLPWGGQDKFVQLDANATHAVWNLIAPAIAEAQAEAWDEAVAAIKGTIGAYTEEGVWVLEQAEKHHPNPHRSNDE